MTHVYLPDDHLQILYNLKQEIDYCESQILLTEDKLAEEFDFPKIFKCITHFEQFPTSLYVNLLSEKLENIINDLIRDMDEKIRIYMNNPALVDHSKFSEKPKYQTRHKKALIGQKKPQMKTKKEMISEIIGNLNYSNMQQFNKIDRTYFLKYQMFVNHSDDMFSIKNYHLLFSNNIVLTVLLVMNRIDVLPTELITMVILPMCTNLELCYTED
jgi:hypothetical protein